MYRVEDTCLLTEEGTVCFETPIREVLEWNGLLIVRLALMARKDDINNVYGVKGGKVVWRVQDEREYNPLLRDPIFSQWNPHTRIDLYEENPELILGTTFAGFRYLIDPNNGRIVGEESCVK